MRPLRPCACGVLLLLASVGSGCWRSHSRSEPAAAPDAGTIVLEDGAVWRPPAPADNCPSDMPELFIPNERGCVSIRVGAGSTVPMLDDLDTPITWRRPIHILLHPDVQYWERGSDRESTARLYLQAVAECPVDDCWVSWTIAPGSRGCTDRGGGIWSEPWALRRPKYIDASRSYPDDTQRYLFLRVTDGIEWLIYGCIGEEPPGYVED